MLSMLSPEEVQALGRLPAEAIAGHVEGEALSVETFRPNPAFVELLHEVVRAAGPSDPDLQAGAREQGEGWLYVIDLRTPDGPDGQVLPEDIIGAFEVQNGQLVAGSYQRTAAHRVYTSNGLVCLTPHLRAALVEQLSRMPSAG